MCRTKVVPVADISSWVDEAPQRVSPPAPSPDGEQCVDMAASSEESSVTECCDHTVPSSPPASEPQHRRNSRHIRPWALIDHPSESILNEPRFAPGFKVEVFDGNLTQHFVIPSECIAPTFGTLRYIEHYNECGPYSRFRFQYCNNFLLGRCTKGAQCTYVHVLEFPRANVLHVKGDANHACLAPGYSMTIFCPHSQAPPQTIPTEYILVTKGSVGAMSQQRGYLRPQHCAHYQYKKICHRGADCNFIHSLVPTMQSQ